MKFFYKENMNINTKNTKELFLNSSYTNANTKSYMRRSCNKS